MHWDTDVRESASRDQQAGDIREAHAGEIPAWRLLGPKQEPGQGRGAGTKEFRKGLQGAKSL